MFLSYFRSFPVFEISGSWQWQRAVILRAIDVKELNHPACFYMIDHFGRQGVAVAEKAMVTDKVTKWDGGVPNNVDKK